MSWEAGKRSVGGFMLLKAAELCPAQGWKHQALFQSSGHLALAAGSSLPAPAAPSRLEKLLLQRCSTSWWLLLPRGREMKQLQGEARRDPGALF